MMSLSKLVNLSINTTKHSSFSPLNLMMLEASTDEENFNVMKTAYSSCTDETALKKLGVEPLVNLIQVVAASFPVTGDNYGVDETVSAQDFASLSETILLLEKMGVTTFEAMGTGADDRNPVSLQDEFSNLLILMTRLGSCHNSSVSGRTDSSISRILQKCRNYPEVSIYDGGGVQQAST
jgi:hypothetical protein